MRSQGVNERRFRAVGQVPGGPEPPGTGLEWVVALLLVVFVDMTQRRWCLLSPPPEVRMGVHETHEKTRKADQCAFLSVHLPDGTRRRFKVFLSCLFVYFVDIPFPSLG